MFALSRWEWLVLAAAVIACPGLSFGADPEASLFDRLDRNKDGYLSPEELSAAEAKSTNWIAIDRNRDGRISRDEFNTQLAQPATKPAPSAATGGTAPAPAPQKQE